MLRDVPLVSYATSKGDSERVIPTTTQDDLDEDVDLRLMMPLKEVLDVWEADENTGAIMRKFFQSEELIGSDRLALRDVYKMLEAFGMRRELFVDLLTGTGGTHEAIQAYADSQSAQYYDYSDYYSDDHELFKDMSQWGRYQPGTDDGDRGRRPDDESGGRGRR